MCCSHVDVIGAHDLLFFDLTTVGFVFGDTVGRDRFGLGLALEDDRGNDTARPMGERAGLATLGQPAGRAAADVDGPQRLASSIVGIDQHLASVARHGSAGEVDGQGTNPHDRLTDDATLLAAQRSTGPRQ